MSNWLDKRPRRNAFAARPEHRQDIRLAPRAEHNTDAEYNVEL